MSEKKKRFFKLRCFIYYLFHPELRGTKDWTKEDWEQYHGEMEYDAMKDDGYFDDSYYEE